MSRTSRIGSVFIPHGPQESVPLAINLAGPSRLFTKVLQVSEINFYSQLLLSSGVLGSIPSLLCLTTGLFFLLWYFQGNPSFHLSILYYISLGNTFLRHNPPYCYHIQINNHSILANTQTVVPQIF